MTGCGGAPDDDAARLPGASPSQRGAVTVPAPSERLYFGVTNHLHVGGDVLAEVKLNAGAVVELEAATSDSSSLRFEVWQVHADKRVELLNAFDVESGFVLTSLTAASDGIFLVHFPAPTSARDVVVHLDCNGRPDGARASSSPGSGASSGARARTGSPARRMTARATPSGRGGTCVVPRDDTACEAPTRRWSAAAIS